MEEKDRVKKNGGKKVGRRQCRMHGRLDVVHPAQIDLSGGKNADCLLVRSASARSLHKGVGSWVGLAMMPRRRHQR